MQIRLNLPADRYVPNDSGAHPIGLTPKKPRRKNSAHNGLNHLTPVDARIFSGHRRFVMFSGSSSNDQGRMVGYATGGALGLVGYNRRGVLYRCGNLRNGAAVNAPIGNVTMGGHVFTSMVTENDRLRARVDALLSANNAECERRRDAERLAAERLQWRDRMVASQLEATRARTDARDQRLRANRLQDQLDNTLLELAQARVQRDDMGEALADALGAAFAAHRRAMRAESVVHRVIGEAEPSVDVRVLFADLAPGHARTRNILALVA